MNILSSRSLGIGVASGVIVAGTVAGLQSFLPGIALPVGLGMLAALVIFFQHGWKQAQQSLNQGYYRGIRKQLDWIELNVKEAAGLAQLSRYNDPYPLPFGGGWALRADSAVLLGRLVWEKRPQVIVELGSGVSTLLCAKLCEQFDQGRVLSLDHDAEWAAHTRANLRRYGLERRAEVINAPLEEVELEGECWQWYGVRSLLDALDSPIDLLIVDGPPSPSNAALSSRYPALPLLHELLASDAVLFIDDANRQGEQKMISRWLVQQPGWRRHDYSVGDGVVVLTREGEY